MHVSLIIKATRLCNLRCIYCNDWRVGNDQSMQFDVLLALIAKVLQDPCHDSIDFIWHGGEPTLLGRSFFDKALYLQARLKGTKQSITNSLQTNATLIDDDWATYLKKNHFSVSISLDGPAYIQDAQRPHVSGRPSSKDVNRGIDRLRKNNVSMSALLVVDRLTLELGPDAMFDFLLAQGVRNFGLLAAKPKNTPGAKPATPTDHYVTPGEMGEFLIRLFDRWLEHGDPEIRIREFNALLRRILGKPAATCVLAGECFGNYYVIEPQGSVAHCDLFLGDSDYTLGHILTDDFADLRSKQQIETLKLQNRVHLEAMKSCANFLICNGWCPHERYTRMHHDPSFTESCCGLSGLIDHIRTKVASSLDQTKADREPILK